MKHVLDHDPAARKHTMVIHDFVEFEAHTLGGKV